MIELLFSKSVTSEEYWDKRNLKWSLRLQTRKWELSGQRLKLPREVTEVGVSITKSVKPEQTVHLKQVFETPESSL